MPLHEVKIDLMGGMRMKRHEYVRLEISDDLSAMARVMMNEMLV